MRRRNVPRHRRNQHRSLVSIARLRPQRRRTASFSSRWSRKSFLWFIKYPSRLSRTCSQSGIAEFVPEQGARPAKADQKCVEGGPLCRFLTLSGPLRAPVGGNGRQRVLLTVPFDRIAEQEDPSHDKAETRAWASLARHDSSS